ncbi:MAG: hypothetical protein ACOX15_04990 [Tepidanaerobacteraceae bacterium]
MNDYGKLYKADYPFEFKLPWNLIPSKLLMIFWLSLFLLTMINLVFEPENPLPAFRPLDPGIALDYVLCVKEERTVIEDGAFSYKGKYYQLVTDGKREIMPKTKIMVLSSSRIGIKASYDGVIYDTLVLEERPKKKALKLSKEQSQKAHPCKACCRASVAQCDKKEAQFRV